MMTQSKAGVARRLAENARKLTATEKGSYREECAYDDLSVFADPEWVIDTLDTLDAFVKLVEVYVVGGMSHYRWKDEAAALLAAWRTPETP